MRFLKFSNKAKKVKYSNFIPRACCFSDIKGCQIYLKENMPWGKG